jgi:triacylglycerol lipase
MPDTDAARRSARADAAGHGRQTVVLLHGLARSARSMAPMARGLEAAGYRVANLDYPSRHHGPDALRRLVADRIDAGAAGAERVHIVGHSLGGLMARAWVEDRRPANLGRVVQLASPNAGSEVVDRLGSWRWFAWVFGPMALSLGTSVGSFPASLAPIDYELGVVAADRSINPIASRMIEGPDDGAVSLASARAEGAADFLVVPVSHTFVMAHPQAIAAVVSFLACGRFDGARR